MIRLKRRNSFLFHHPGHTRRIVALFSVRLQLTRYTTDHKVRKRHYRYDSCVGRLGALPHDGSLGRRIPGAAPPKCASSISAGGAGKGMADALAGLVDIGMISRSIRPGGDQSRRILRAGHERHRSPRHQPEQPGARSKACWKPASLARSSTTSGSPASRSRGVS